MLFSFQSGTVQTELETRGGGREPKEAMSHVNSCFTFQFFAGERIITTYIFIYDIRSSSEKVC